MFVVRRLFGPIFGLVLGVVLSGCGISVYPGQPGVVTNSYSKIDLENLDVEGLWVYEVVYDNTEGGKGVGAIVTKLYPGAQTHTSNVRTNADGTLYRNKAQYNGAEVQMIAIPSLNQVHVAPNSKVQFLLEYTTSLDEIDDKNVAEQSLFKPDALVRVSRAIQLRWQLLKLAKLTGRGLAYEVTAVKFGDKKFTPAKPILVETNLSQNGIRTTITPELKQELTHFVETNFPKGFKGKAEFYFKGAADSISVSLGMHSFKTAEAAGIKIIKDASDELASDIVNRFNRGNL